MPLSPTPPSSLFFRKVGEKGRPIVILHGLYGSSDNWMTIARKLSETYQVYSIDQRNHGQSPHYDTHSYEAMKEDLATFFAEQNITKAIVMGHSMGGKTAMLFAADYPQLVEQLIVVDICPKDYSALGENSQIHEHQLILETLLDLQQLRSSFHSRREVIDYLELKLDSKELVLFLSKSIAWDREQSTFHLLLNAEVLHDSLDEIINGVSAYRLSAKNDQADYEVLFVRGLNSPYISNDDIALIKGIYPQASLVDIPQAGHWLHVEQTQLFLACLFQFINK